MAGGFFCANVSVRKKTLFVLAQTASSLKNWIIALIKNIIMLAIIYKILLWGLASISELIGILNDLFAWLHHQHILIFYLGAAAAVFAIYLLGKISVTQLWIFKLKQDAERNSYFAIKQKAVDGGWYYGFVNTVHRVGEKKLYDAVIFSGGLTRKFEMTENEFVRLNLTIPEVLFYGYVAVIFPFLAKQHPPVRQTEKENEK